VFAHGAVESKQRLGVVGRLSLEAKQFPFMKIKKGG
jgi:hypothetical protein